MESTLLSPARNVVEMQDGAMATATGQKGSAKGRVQVSTVEGTMQTPAMIVVAMQKCAMETASGQNASAKGRVQMSITVCMGIYCLCVETFPIIFRQRWRVESMGPLGQLQ